VIKERHTREAHQNGKHHKVIPIDRLNKKFLRTEGEITMAIDREELREEAHRDCLKDHMTNT